MRNNMLHERINIRNKGDAYLNTYIIDDPLEQNRKRPIIVICPGGGYEFCSPREAEPVALAFNAAGYHAAVLFYSLRQMFPASLMDLSDAVCIVRDNTANWNIDTDKVIVCGFSAGGHLAASLGVLWNSEPSIKREDSKNKPNGMILAYPVITSGEYRHKGSIENITNNDTELIEKVSLEKHISSDCPPAFIWHTFNDETVPIENSLSFAMSMAKKKRSTELHVFPNGPHGLSLANEWVADQKDRVVTEVQSWINMAVRWVSKL